MWPFGKVTKDFRIKAEVVAPLLVEGCKETSPMFLKGLIGEEVSASNQALLDPLSIEVLAIALHLTDRLTFAHLGSDERTLFMDALLPAIKRLLQPPFDENLADLYNTRNQFYAGFSKLFPDNNENLKGTLFWEFGKALAAIYANNNPVAVTMAATAGMDLLKVINDLLLSEEVIRR